MKLKREYFYCFLILIISGFSNCENKTVECKGQEHVKRLSCAFANVNFILHSISKYSFLSNLHTLTFYKEFHYNIDPDRKKFYQFSFSTLNKDTTEAIILKEISFNFKPLDFCFNDFDLYILTDAKNPTIIKYPNVLNNDHSKSIEIDIMKGQILVDSVFTFPQYSRLCIRNSRFIIGTFGKLFSGDTNKRPTYYQKYDLQLRRVVSSFAEVPEISSNKYFASIQMPFRLDIDSVSLVSFGFENFIQMYDNRTGEKLGKFCAKSAYINSVEGIAFSDAEDFQHTFNYAIGTAYYLDLIYDKNSKCFYRIAKHNQKIKNNVSMRLNKIDAASWSLVVLDQNLNLVNEVAFSQKKLSFLNYFSDNNGIHFLTINSLYGNPRDSVLQFKTLILK